jgi:hypothetical protein
MSSTKIDDLPTDNVSLEKKEVVQQPTLENSQVPPNIQPVDNNSINRIVSTLNNNPDIGQLPSRDIPIQTVNHTNDQTVQPNYVPQNRLPNDYIKEYETFTSLANKNKEENEKKDRLDLLYEELKLPLIAAALFFLFQLPFVKKLLLTKLPSLFTGDGQPKMSLYILKTSLFLGMFYWSQKILFV